jgi:dTDP-4-dehydrorhamnose 3,5-epimerase
MGKLVRTICGHMIDIVLDIRIGSNTFGKAFMYDMPVHKDFGEWIWVPPGFAHGNLFLDDTTIEYFCTGSYNKSCEAGISPLSNDIDWSLCSDKHRDMLIYNANAYNLITDKDINGFSLQKWSTSDKADNFLYKDLKC